MVSEKKYLVAIGEFPKISTEVWKSLFFRFKNFEKAWKASDAEIKTARLPVNILNDFVAYRQKTDPNKVWGEYQKLGIDVRSLTDKKYPSLLKEIYNPPFLLYIKGELPDSKVPTLAVVGSRKATDYGRRITRDITRGVASEGITIISGLALGLRSTSGGP
jgi:DNA processing protein